MCEHYQLCYVCCSTLQKGQIVNFLEILFLQDCHFMNCGSRPVRAKNMIIPPVTIGTGAVAISLSWESQPTINEKRPTRKTSIRMFIFLHCSFAPPLHISISVYERYFPALG